ncbi:MAG TPA: PEP-CTERM sorting domain-containing protein [Chloroflexota bacterium]
MSLRPGAAGMLAAVVLILATGTSASGEDLVYSGFDASLDTGSLAGAAFSVCYSYDAAQVAPTGQSYVPLSSLDFSLLGTPFARSDIFQGGQVELQDQVVQDVTASFQVRLPAGAPVSNITFGFGGPGVIGYIDLNGQYGQGSFALDSQASGCARNAAENPAWHVGPRLPPS